MKKLISICFLLFFAVIGNAQVKSSLIFSNALVRDKNMERTGTVLIVIGGVALFAGNILYWKIYNDYGNKEPPKDKVDTYGHVILGGLGLMTVGIPLWAIGRVKERHIKIEAELVKFKGKASVNGIELKIRF
jgi:hypothetical protein